MSGAILFVTRNNLALSKLAVSSAASQDVPCDILVIDNDSTDGTRDWLKTKGVSTIFNESQQSLAACWNRGIQALFYVGYPAVLVCNNDIKLHYRTYRALNACHQPFITGVSVDSEQQMREQDRTVNVGKLMNSSSPHPDFSCFMIRPEVTAKVGWFDERYSPAYCEDNDYHVRMHRAGIRTIAVDVPFFHPKSSTIVNASPGEKARVARGADRNRELFKQKYGCYPWDQEYSKLFNESSFGKGYKR